MNTLTFDIQDEHFVRVLSALEGQFLSESFVSIRSEHHIDGLPLAWLQGTVVRPNLESLTVVIFAVTALPKRVSFGLLREGPVARDFLIVLKSDLDSLASVDADTVEIKRLWVESELGDCHIGDKFDRVLRSILDIDRDLIALLAKFRCLSGGEDHIEELTSIGKQICNFIWFDVQASSVERFLAEVE